MGKILNLDFSEPLIFALFSWFFASMDQEIAGSGSKMLKHKLIFNTVGSKAKKNFPFVKNQQKPQKLAKLSIIPDTPPGGTLGGFPRLKIT